MSERTIIGEGERAGWPLSVLNMTEAQARTHAGRLRFRQRDGFFVLEERWIDGWVEVPLVVPDEKEKP